MDNIRSEDLSKRSLVEEEQNKDELVEGYDLSVNARTHSTLTTVFDIFGNKYYKCPLEGINEDVRLYDKNNKEVKFDIRQVTIKPFEINIITCLNKKRKES